MGIYILGESEEENDFITINEKYRFSGLMGSHPAEMLLGGTLPTKCIRVKFQTNGSVIQGKGLTVGLGMIDAL